MADDPELSGDELAAVVAAQADRLRRLDPRIAQPVPTDPPAGTPLVARAGGSTAVGLARRTANDADALTASWAALDVHTLTPWLAGPDPAAALDALLRRWRRHLAGQPGIGPDSSAVITWPSRDTAAARALFRHGLAPMTVVATRPAGTPVRAGPPAGCVLRPAGPDDEEELAALRLAVLRFDAAFGVVTERPATPRLVAAEAARSLRTPWTWVAERAGRVVGTVTVDPPGAADWLGVRFAPAPFGYVDVLGVAAAERGAGVGSALLARAHEALDAAGTALIGLHHAGPNPLSTPFYHRHGYRPSLTIWEIRPATALLR